MERILTFTPKKQPGKVGRCFKEDLPGRAVKQTVWSEESIGVEKSIKSLPEK